MAFAAVPNTFEKNPAIGVDSETIYFLLEGNKVIVSITVTSKNAEICRRAQNQHEGAAGKALPSDAIIPKESPRRLHF